MQNKIVSSNGENTKPSGRTPPPRRPTNFAMIIAIGLVVLAAFLIVVTAIFNMAKPVGT